MAKEPAVGMMHPALFKRDRVEAILVVGELDLVPHNEGPRTVEACSDGGVGFVRRSHDSESTWLLRTSPASVQRAGYILRKNHAHKLTCVVAHEIGGRLISLHGSEKVAPLGTPIEHRCPHHG